MFVNSLSKQLHLLKLEPALSAHLSLTGNSDFSEMPILHLGMTGFNHSQRQQIEGIVSALPQQTAVWRIGQFTQANAWLLCGEKTRSMPDNTAGEVSLRVLAGLPSEHAMTLNLHQIDRPLAFSTPLNDPDIDARFTFEPASPLSLYNLLTNFESCLKSLRLHFALGKQLIANETELRATIYHVMHEAKLLAVMDFIDWKIGLLPGADPRDLENAVWEKRPPHAGAIPSNFLLTDVAKLRWIYAQHSARNVLPERYRNGLIYFRQAPKIAPSWLTDSHLRLIHELTQQPASLADLAERCGLPREQISQDLSCLYYANALTTQASKAQKKGRVKDDSARLSHSAFQSSLQSNHQLTTDPDTTVAARLM